MQVALRIRTPRKRTLSGGVRAGQTPRCGNVSPGCTKEFKLSSRMSAVENCFIVQFLEQRFQANESVTAAHHGKPRYSKWAKWNSLDWLSKSKRSPVQQDCLDKPRSTLEAHECFEKANQIILQFRVPSPSLRSLYCSKEILLQKIVERENIFSASRKEVSKKAEKRKENLFENAKINDGPPCRSLSGYTK